MKIGRNDPCPCGSGKKFKKCCQDKNEVRPTELNIQPKNLPPSPDELNHLVTLFEAGRYVELENRTRLLVEQFPESGFVWKVLGVALLAQGKDALHAMQMATNLLPDDAEVHCNLGNVLRGLGQLDNSAASYRRALELKPDFAEAHYNLGNYLRDIGQLDNAVTHYRRALEIKPEFVEASSNLGNILHDLGQLEDAVACYRSALEISPNHAESHSNLGNTLQALGQLEGAVESYRRALELNPDYAEAYYNLGNAQQELGQLEGAVESYRNALKIKPDYAEAHYNLGNVLQELRRLEEAVTSYRRVLEIKPDFSAKQRHSGAVDKHHPDETIVHVNLGNVLLDMGELVAAEKHFDIALRHDPESALAHQGMACLFQRLGKEETSRYHRDLGFGKQPLSTVTYRGRGEPVSLLVMGSALEGNIPWRFLIDRERFQTTLMTVEYFDDTQPLPTHQLILNAIGDADIAQEGLEIASRLVEKSKAPILNRPQAVLQTGRLMNAKRLGRLSGVVAPRIALVSKDEVDSGNAWERLDNKGLAYPLLLRPPGFHGGNYFVCVDDQDQFKSAFADLPGEMQLVIEFLDSGLKENLFRKYRVMAINGALYPIHMALSSNWKVHYFSSDMDENEEYRNEEKAFLNDFSSFLGEDALSALERISQTLNLDYCGIDFGIDKKGNILLYEANATMLISQPGNERRWDYKRQAIENALAATKRMFVERIN